MDIDHDDSYLAEQKRQLRAFIDRVEGRVEFQWPYHVPRDIQKRSNAALNESIRNLGKADRYMGRATWA